MLIIYTRNCNINLIFWGYKRSGAIRETQRVRWIVTINNQTNVIRINVDTYSNINNDEFNVRAERFCIFAHKLVCPISFYFYVSFIMHVFIMQFILIVTSPLVLCDGHLRSMKCISFVHRLLTKFTVIQFDIIIEVVITLPFLFSKKCW